MAFIAKGIQPLLSVNTSKSLLNLLVGCSSRQQIQIFLLSARVRIVGFPIFWRNVSAVPKRISDAYVKSGLNSEVKKVVTATEIKKFLNANKADVVKGHTCFIVPHCPLCSHIHENVKPGTMYINMTTGWFKCDTCRQFGEWSDFVDNLNTLQATKPDSKANLRLKTKELYVSGELWDQYEKATHLTQLSDEKLKDIQSAFKIKGLKAQTMDHFGFRYGEDGSMLVPMHDTNKNISAIKKFSLSDDNSVSGFSTEPRNCFDFCFGSTDVSTTASDIVITDHPFNMAAINQELENISCIALPDGTSHLSQHLLPYFEQFKNIIFWFGQCSSWEATKMFARKLNMSRCSFIRIKDDQPSPTEAITRGYNLSKILKKCEPLKHDSVTSFQFLRSDVFRELSNAEMVAGVKWCRFPHLNKLLKGHRRGELTIFTGPTGAGKTTFMSEYSLDLCMQGVNTLWGSFEIQNVKLAKTMLKQFSNIALDENLNKFDEWSDKFEQLPMYFMKFHGQQSLKDVLQTMSHAVYVHDIQHVIIDNLQFMMGYDESTFDRYFRQDIIIGEFRKFATMENCHVSLVMHPRKEKEGDSLSISSIFGGVKATQEADNGMNFF